jgi:gliding motility-associated-like protein
MSLIRSLFLVLLLISHVLGFSQNRTAIPKTIENHSHSFDQAKKLIENKGQWPKGVLFQTKMDGGKLWVQQRKMIFHLQDYSAMHRAHAARDTNFHSDVVRETLVHLNFIGSNETHNIEKINPTKHYFNYFKGNDSSKWASDVRGYESALLRDFYNGIDLKVITKSDKFKYEFYVHPGVNSNAIKLNYVGQKLIYIDPKGNLIIETELGKIIEQKPYAYQLINGKESKVKCKFKLEGDSLTFDLGKYDENKVLVIDPEIIFASYSGSDSDNFGMTATYDYQGNLYSGGIVFGNSYPTTAGVYDADGTFSQVNAGANVALVYGVTDIFISKYSSDGTTLLYSTYIGGGSDFGGTEVVHSLICNEQNELYFFGTTSSSDFPLVNPVQSNFNGGLYREFSSNGTHFYGNNQSQANGGTDLIICKLSSDGSALLGSTYYGGNRNDGLNYIESGNVNGNQFGGLMYNYGDPFRGEIMLDDNGNVYIASCTYSTNFPLVNPTQPTIGGSLDGVLIKFNSTLSSVLWSTYLGGSSRDACYAIKFDSFGNAYTTGGTLSSNFPITPGAFKTAHSGNNQPDAFITKYGSNLSLLKSTFVGTTQYDQSFFIQIDRSDFVYILGQSRGSITPSPGKYSNANSGQFIMKFNNNLESQVWQTVFGNGNGLVNISPTAFLVDVCGNIYVSGWGGGIAGSLQQGTALTGMPITSDAAQTGSGDGYNLYLVVFSSQAEQLLYGTYLGGLNSQEHVDGGTSRFDSQGIVYHSACGGCGANSDFPTTTGAWSNTNNSNNCNNVVFKFSTGVIPEADFTADQTQGCNDFTVTFDNFSTEDDTYLWDFGDGHLDSTTFNPVITYVEAGTYTVNLYVTDSICLLTDTARIVINVYDSIILNVPSPMIGCNNQPMTISANSNGTATNFIWSMNSDMTNPLNNPNDSTITIQPSQPGTYYVEASNGFCTKRDTVEVLFSPPATSNLEPDITIGCLPLTVTFTNLSQNEDSVRWNFGDGNSGVNLNDSTHIFNQPGVYTVLLIASDSICLTPDTSSAIISVLDSINLYTLSPVFICNNDPYTMVAETYGTANNIIWSASPNFSNPLNDNPNDPDIVLTSNGTYYVSASNGYCSDTDSTTITFNTPPQVTFTPLTPSGCAPLAVTFDNTSTQSNFFEWNFGNGVTDSENFEPTIVYNTPGTFDVQLIVTDPDCPINDTAFYEITVYGNPQVSLDDSEVVCNQSTTILSAGIPISNYIYVWSSSSNFSDVLNSNNSPDLLVSNSGTYFLSVSNNGCVIEDSIDVDFIPIPVATFTLDDETGCNPLTVSFSSSPNENSDFLWDFGNGVLDSTSLTPSFTFNSSGDYLVSLIITETICSFSDTATATITVLPQISISQNDTIELCVSVPIQFSPTFAGSPTQFIWSSNTDFSDTLNSDLSQSELLVNDPQPGYYYFLASNGECFTKDSVLVQFVSADLSLSISNSICVGETATITATNSNPLITFDYNWSPSSIIVNPTNSSQIEVNPTTSQYIYLSATSSNGCFIQDSIYINVSYIDPTLVVASASENSVTPGSVVVLSGLPNGLISYSWTPTAGLTSPNAQTTNATVEENTIYTLTVSDGTCSKKDTVEVKVYQLICSGEYLFIPNAFTPNGDNFNDILYLRGHNIEKMIFRIFDRWGEMVFESTDKNIGWDGTFRGKKLDPDVYDYYLDITCVGGLNEVIKGNVTLIK